MGLTMMSLTIKLSDHGFARTCYGHLAGELGVAVTEALIDDGMLRIASETTYEVTAHGEAWLHSLGVVLVDLKPSLRVVGRRCFDGTERRHHLGGPLAVRLLERMVSLGWLERMQTDRALILTQAGAQALAGSLGIRTLPTSLQLNPSTI